MAFPIDLGGRVACIKGWHDLEKYGINVLTGESCGIGIRILCDLSPEGVRLIEQFLSIPMAERNNSWNHQGQKGWKSIMLSRGVFNDLATFCLARDGFKYIAIVNWSAKNIGTAHYIEGFKDEELFGEFREMANKIYGSDSWHGYVNSGTAGTRNRHGWTGRVD